MAAALAAKRQDESGSYDVVMGGQDTRLRDALTGIADRLQGLVTDQVSKRHPIEQRWLADLRQYHGRYDPKTEARLNANKDSKLFFHLSRVKCNAWEAWLGDMLFPTDDRNWGISPTPVPELVDQANRLDSEASRTALEANRLRDLGQEDAAQALIEQQGNPAAAQAAELQARLDEAKRRAEAMQMEIDDQLKETHYNIRSRQVIHDLVKLGTGIMKGPQTMHRVRKRWERGADGTYEMMQAGDPRPENVRVNPWAFFPDMSGSRPEQWSFTFERHLLTHADVRALSRRPGFDSDALRDLLKERPRDLLPDYMLQLREITYNDQTALDVQRYQAWEYHGEIEAEEMLTLALSVSDDERQRELIQQLESDPLDEYRVILWFCQGRILKFGPHPLDSGESLYSTVCFEPDETSPFGFGVPYLMRDSQAAGNAAWRLMMDNAAMSAAPQIIVNEDAIEPENGSWDFTPKKVWKEKKLPTNVQAGYSPIRAVTIDSRYDHLVGIIDLSRQMADEESGMTQLAQGEQGQQVTKTAQGMAMLMNSTNVLKRRVVRRWDDDMTIPTIRRMYDWNMQFSSKDHIKGDYEVDARGSSVLLVRDVQAQNLANIATVWSQHPVIAPMLKGYDTAAKALQAMGISPDDLLKPKDEVERDAAAMEQNPPPDPEIVRIQTQRELVEFEGNLKLQLAEIQRETAMVGYATKQNIELDKLDAMLADRREERASRERKIAAEISMAERTGKSSGGYV